MFRIFLKRIAVLVNVIVWQISMEWSIYKEKLKCVVDDLCINSKLNRMKNRKRERNCTHYPSMIHTVYTLILWCASTKLTCDIDSGCKIMYKTFTYFRLNDVLLLLLGKTLFGVAKQAFAYLVLSESRKKYTRIGNIYVQIICLPFDYAVGSVCKT